MSSVAYVLQDDKLRRSYLLGCESALIPDNMISSDRNTADYRQVASENRKAKIEGDSRRASRQAADNEVYQQPGISYQGSTRKA